MGFFVIYVAAKLSLLIGMGKIKATCSCESILVSQASSAITTHIDLYFAFTDDKANVGCFFNFQEIGLPPNIWNTHWLTS